MEKRRSITFNACLNTVKTVFGIIFPLITYPYVFRVLGVENIGIYTYSYSYISYFLLIAGLGISTYGIRQGALYRDDRNKIKCFVSELFSIGVISTLISYGLLIIFIFLCPLAFPYFKALLILSVEILFASIGVTWVFNIYEDFFALTIITIVSQVLSLVLLFVFVKTSSDIYKYITILVLSNSGSNLISFFYVRKKYCKFSFTSSIDLKKHLKPILLLFSTSVAITIYVSSDNTILGIMTNDYQVGVYGTAVKIYTIIKSIMSAILTVLIPKLSIVFSSNDKNHINRVFSSIFNTMTALVLPMCVGLYFLSDEVILIVSGPAYYESAAPLRILSVAMFFSLYAFLYTQCVLIPVGKENYVFRATLFSAILNVLLNIILIPIGGVNAAAFTTVLAEIAVFLISLYYSKSSVKLVGISKNIVISVAGSIVIIFECIFFKGIENLVVRISITILLSVISYCIIHLLFHSPIISEIKSLKSTKKKHVNDI